MAINPSIALGVQPPQQTNPLAMVMQFEQLRTQRESADALAEQRRAMTEERELKIAAAQRQQFEEGKLRELFSTEGGAQPWQVYSVVGPERGAKILEAIAALGEQNIQTEDALWGQVAAVTGGIQALPDGLRQDAYQLARQQFIAKGVPAEQIPEAYSPEVIESFNLRAMDPKARQEAQQPNLTEVSPGASLVDPKNPQGGAVFTAPEKPPTVGSFEDFIARKAAEMGRRVDQLSPRDIATARQAWTEAGRDQTPVTRFQSVEVLNDAGKPIRANFNATTGTYTDPATGQPIKVPGRVPTAAESQDTRKFRQAGPILSAVSELSEKINTQQGAIAKNSGAVEKAKAQANYNDDVAEYEALISGFTPLVARALGHTGVLTQQDVDSVKALFPKPGDSKSLRDRKIARITAIIGQLEADSIETPMPVGKPTHRFNQETGQVEAIGAEGR